MRQVEYVFHTAALLQRFLYFLIIFQQLNRQPAYRILNIRLGLDRCCHGSDQMFQRRTVVDLNLRRLAFLGNTRHIFQQRNGSDVAAAYRLYDSDAQCVT